MKKQRFWACSLSFKSETAVATMISLSRARGQLSHI